MKKSPKQDGSDKEEEVHHFVASAGDGCDSDDELLQILQNSKVFKDAVIKLQTVDNGPCVEIEMPAGGWKVVSIQDVGDAFDANEEDGLMDLEKDDRNPCDDIPVDENAVREYFAIPKEMWKRNMRATGIPCSMECDDDAGAAGDVSSPRDESEGAQQDNDARVDASAVAEGVSLLF